MACTSISEKLGNILLENENDFFFKINNINFKYILSGQLKAYGTATALALIPAGVRRQPQLHLEPAGAGTQTLLWRLDLPLTCRTNLPLFWPLKGDFSYLIFCFTLVSLGSVQADRYKI